MDFDFCVLGAGIAGLCVADRLSEREKSVVVVDPNHTGAGASGTPSALLNPATGRYAYQSWRAADCVRSAYQTLEKVQEDTDETLFRKNGVIRPASTQKIARRMRENFEKSTWPDGWCEWIDEGRFLKDYPGVKCITGAIRINAGATVQPVLFLQKFAEQLIKRGVYFCEGHSYQIEGHRVLLSNGSELRARHFITAAGNHSVNIKPWGFLPLHPVKGQLAILRHEGGFPFESSVSSLGYYTPFRKDSFAVGSTYEHDFSHEEPDKQGLNYLLGRLEKVMPLLKEHSEPVDQWAGIRASTPGKMPIAGTHPEYPHHSVLTGLGSKGLLYSSFLAECLTKHLIDGEVLPKEVHVDRFL